MRTRGGVAAALIGLAGLAVGVSTADATSLTPGDVVVYRVGSGASALSGSAYPVYLDEYSPSGTLVESVALPTAVNGSNKPLVASGSASSEGLLTLSANGEYLMLTGYDAAAGTASISGTKASSVPRTIGRVAADGEVNTSTALTDFASENNPRSATSTNGNEIWVGGAAGGVRYATLGASTSTSLASSTDKNVREVSIFDGQLYTSADPTKAGLTIATVGSGLPTSGEQTITNLPFATAPAEPYGYAFLKLGSGAEPDTLYLADNSAGAVVKYGLISGKWTEEGSVSVPSVTGLTANDSEGVVTIFATSSGSSGETGALYEITDTSGLGGTLSGGASEIAKAPANEAFRGVAFAPGTKIGSGGASKPPATPTVTPSETYLANAIGDPTNPGIGVTVADSEYAAGELTLTATSSNTAVAPQSGVQLSGSGATRTLTVTPASVGYSTITLTVEAPNGTKGTATVTYAASANLGFPSNRYYAGAGNASTAIDVGDGYFIAGDDENNVLRLYDASTSGMPVKTFDFTNVLPFGSTEMDIEASARAGNILYWMGSLSNSKKGKLEPARDVVFAAQITGEGASTELTYLGSYTELRQDLIRWDEANGNPLGFKASTEEGVASNQASGFNVEGLEFARGSSSTAYLAFRAPLEPTSSRTKALLVPVTNFSSLIGGGLTKATFGSALEWNLGGLGLRELRQNGNGQYLAIAGTSDDSNSSFRLYTWDGSPADQPVPTRNEPVSEAEGAWESIVSVPTPLKEGSEVELIEDNGDTVWYDDGLDSKDGLPAPLMKDVGQTFEIELAEQQITWETAPPTTPSIGESYTPAASSTSGQAVTFSIDSSSSEDACALNGKAVDFTGPGTCVIDAEVAASESYGAARSQQSFAIVESSSGQTTVEGKVSSTLALSVASGTASLGTFTPGVARSYEASIAANVTSTAGNATLTAYDPSASDTGHLVNGSFELPSTLQVRASDPSDTTAAFGPLGGAGAPLTLLSYGGPVSNDPVTVTFKQAIGSDDALRTGSYGKTVVLTLSTDSP